YYPVAWSLSVEEWYYVLFPVFLLLYGRFSSRTNEWLETVWATVLFIGGITLIRTVYGDTADWGAQVRRVVVFRIDSIAYWFLLYLVLLRVKFEWTGRLRSLSLLALAGITVLLLAINIKMLESNAAWFRQINPLVSAAFGMTLLASFLSINSLLRAQWMK